MKVAKKTIYVVIPLLLAACKQKPLDPAVQAQIDDVTAQKAAADTNVKVAQDSAKFYADKGDAMRTGAAKMYADARKADRNAVASKYALNKVFTPDQVAKIKKAVEIRGRASFVSDLYDNIMADKASLIDVIKVMSEISNADKIAKMESVANGILGFDKDSDGFFAVFVDSKIHAMAGKEAEELSRLSEMAFKAPEMKKIENAYKRSHAEAIRCDSIAENYKQMEKTYSWRSDSLDRVLNKIKTR